MAATLMVHDETATGRRLRSFTLSVPAARLTVRELISHRIRQEVDAYNRASSEVFEGLVQPTDTEWVLNGYRMKTRRPLDPEAQVAFALQAFQGNGMIVLVDDRQVESLDEAVAVTPTTHVRFLKLVPLVGG
jgi:hypothetical protein